jgi:Tat protein translocase TatB subunit
MFNVGPLELLVIVIVALIVVGPEKLPDLARTVGRMMRELRKIQDDLRDTIRFDNDETPEPAEHQVRPIYDEPSEPPAELSEGLPEDEPELPSGYEAEPRSEGDVYPDAGDVMGGAGTDTATSHEPWAGSVEPHEPGQRAGDGEEPDAHDP